MTVTELTILDLTEDELAYFIAVALNRRMHNPASCKA
jgi:hypothetical protein